MMYEKILTNNKNLSMINKNLVLFFNSIKIPIGDLNMPRKPRSLQKGNFFHVIAQGYEKKSIFSKDQFKSEYLKLMLREKSKFDIKLLTYCIMDNHVHILLYCERTDEMSKYMKSVNTQYAIYYNKMQNRVGYVFRDRFLSEPIQSKNHLYSCVAYIHYNPVVAGIIRKPEDYYYSSYNDFLSKSGIADDNTIEKLFGGTDGYFELFHFIHLEAGKGFDLKPDTPRVTLKKAEAIISQLLRKLSISELKNENYEVQKRCFKRLLQEGVTIYHIEKILKVDHRKVKRMIKR